MKRGPYRQWAPWTAQDDMTLRKMWRQDRYDHEIGAVLNRSRYDVGHRRRSLGMPGVKYRGHPPEVRKKIRAADFERWKNPEIATRMLEGLARGRAAWSAMPPSERNRSFI
jgi:hypothetical protein